MTVRWVALICLVLALSSALSPATPAAETLDTHVVLLDGSGKLLSWVTPQDRAYDSAMSLSWELLLNSPPIDPRNGDRKSVV